jgi:hypothetical protein
MFFFVVFLLAFIGCLIYWHNVLIPKNNKALVSLLTERKSLFSLNQIEVSFVENGGDTDGGVFKLLIYKHCIILLKKNGDYLSYSYILTSKDFKDEQLKKYFIYFGMIKKTELNFSNLEITFRQTSKSLFNEFSRTQPRDTVISIALGTDMETVRKALTNAGITF